MTLKIREATVADAEILLQLVKELAHYEKKDPKFVNITLEKIIQDGFGPSRYFYSLLAENQTGFVGYAIYYFTYSSTMGTPLMYLQDIFVRDPFKRQGIGRQFYVELSRIALEKQCNLIEWHVFNWNEPAIAFYESVGGEFNRQLIKVRLPHRAMQNLVPIST
jgi:GNAT superfamily N-acetyltransferase